MSRRKDKAGRLEKRRRKEKRGRDKQKKKRLDG